MDRKEFLSLCGGACLGLVGLSLAGCGASQIFPSTVNGKTLMVSKSAFVKEEKNRPSLRRFILVQPEGMDYPIVIYRLEDGNHSALLMRCTHQGAELRASGNILTCAAHGSEFDSNGTPVQGPADQKLKSFPVKSDEKTIYVDLS